MIDIEKTWLEHSGGTKFYETVLFKDSSSRQAMLVKRYGAMPTAKGGGQIIVERGTIDSMRESQRKIIGEKTASRKGYDHAHSSYGFHALRSNGSHELQTVLTTTHYTGANGDVYRQLREYFPTDAAPVVVPAPSAPEPEIDRGSTWGSF